MRLWTLAMIVAAVGVVSAGQVQAATIVSEPFDYSNTDPTLSTADGANNGGSGFTGPWGTPASPPSADVNLSADDVSLIYPAGTTLVSSGDRVREINGTLGGRADRLMSTTFDASTESTYYFSLLAKKRLAGGSFFSISLLDGTGAQFFSTGAGSGSSGVRIGRTSNTGAGGGATEFFANSPNGLLANETYMYLGKIVFHAGAMPDEYYLNIYRTGVDTVDATEPGSWMFTHTNDSAPATSLFGNTLSISLGSMSGATADTNVDEVRFSTTYDDAAGVPEPGTLGLTLLAVATFLSRRGGRSEGR